MNKGVFYNLIREKFLDTLIWPRITNGTLTLWQRLENNIESPKENQDYTDAELLREVKEYASIDDFLVNSPDNSRLGIFGLDGDKFVKIPDYQTSNVERSIPNYFRGEHNMLIYSQGESLYFNFDKIDLNRESGKDELNFKLYQGDEVVYVQNFSDDGNETSDGKIGEIMPCQVNLPSLSPGAYRLKIETSNEVLFGEIKTNIQYLNFTDLIFLAEGPDYFVDEGFSELIVNINTDVMTFDVPHDSAVGQNIIIEKNG